MFFCCCFFFFHLIAPFFQSVASLLGMTKSEVCDLLTTLEQDQSFQHTPPANKSFESTVSLSITSFLGCFEFASVKSRSNDEEARADDRDGPSGVGSGITVAVRRGLSSDMTLQLGKLIEVQPDVLISLMAVKHSVLRIALLPELSSQFCEVLFSCKTT